MNFDRTSRENFSLAAIYKQLDLAKIDRSVIETDKDNWFHNNTMTPGQHQEWKTWFIEEFRKVFKKSKKEAEREFSFFSLNYGLRIKTATH
jgi:hypothetical protein